MCDFVVDKAIAEMVNKTTVLVCGSHLDESAKKLQKHIYLIKANYSRDASPEEINLALASAAPKAERYYLNIKEGVNFTLTASRAFVYDEVVVVCNTVSLWWGTSGGRTIGSDQQRYI